MSQELNLKSVFTDACNYIDKIVGRYVHDYQARISKHEDRDGYLISLSANCKSPSCPFIVLASISSTQDAWSSQIVHFFIQRAEFHAKAEHKIITDFMKVPKTRITHRQTGGKGS